MDLGHGDSTTGFHGLDLTVFQQDWMDWTFLRMQVSGFLSDLGTVFQQDLGRYKLFRDRICKSRS